MNIARRKKNSMHPYYDHPLDQASGGSVWKIVCEHVLTLHKDYSNPGGIIGKTCWRISNNKNIIFLGEVKPGMSRYFYKFMCPDKNDNAVIGWLSSDETYGTIKRMQG